MGIKDWFRRKDEVIDFSDLQKRGIIKQKTASKSESGVVELTDKNSENNPLGFLGALAGASGESESSNEDTETLHSSVFPSDGKHRIKGILRDMKTEIKNTTSKVYKLTDRLDLLEKKLERLERKANYGQ